MRKSPVVTNNKKKRGQKKSSAFKVLLSFLNKIMPYVLSVFFVITLFAIAGIGGSFGKGIKSLFGGLFSNFGTYFTAIFLLFHALMWYYDVNRKICKRRVACSLVTVISVATLQHIITGTKSSEILVYNLKTLYTLGKTGQGGGVFGGFFGTLLFDLLGNAGAIAIALLILFFMILQMFNITPASITKKVLGDRRARRNEQIEKEKERRRITASLKHRKFNVYDDEDDNSFTTSTIEKIEIPEIHIEDKPTYQTERAPISREPIAPINEQPKPQSSFGYFNSQKEPLENEFVLSSPYNSPKQTSSMDNSTYTPISSYTPTKQTNEFTYTERRVTDNFSDDTVSKREFETSDYKVGDINSWDDTQPVYEPTPVYEQPKSVYEPTPSFEPSPVYSDSYEDDEFIDDDLEDAIYAEEHKEETLSDFLSDNAFKQIKGYEKPEPIAPAPQPVYQQPVVQTPPPAPAVSPAPVKKPKKKYVFPPIDIFEERIQDDDKNASNEELEQNARIIVETLSSFNAKTRIVDVQRGPTVTRYELVPEAGVRVRSIANLVDDIALNLAAEGIRIECPIPGKAAVGIEVPNKVTSIVYLRSLLEDPQFKKAKSVATCAVGKSISGENIYIDIAKMPHLLVAGATGMGKSVCINALLVSLLYKATPDELRLILIDPKRVEFSVFNGLPHLLVPVVCEAKKSIGTLQWAVAEMERRFELLQESGVRDIGEYNDRVDRGLITADKFSRIVIVIDELYDLKMQVPEIDEHIIRLTQKARAAGIHVVIGTQRPSVDVITGVIKANIPSRIAFRVPAQVDSRTILDEVGAEKLVSRGDMLLKPVGALKPIRVQGAFITEDERMAVVEFIKANSNGANYDDEVASQIDSLTAKLTKADKSADADGGDSHDSDLDEKFYAALEIATDMGKISSSFLQRKLNLGFQRAARIIDQMEAMGYIGEQNGSKPRDVLITKQDFMELRMRNEE